jgi:hypothetical protein
MKKFIDSVFRRNTERDARLFSLFKNIDIIHYLSITFSIRVYPSYSNISHHNFSIIKLITFYVIIFHLS